MECAPQFDQVWRTIIFCERRKKDLHDALQSGVVNSHGSLLPRRLFRFRAVPRVNRLPLFPTTAGAGRDRHIDQGTEHRAGPCSSNVFSCAALPAEVGHLGCCVDPFSHASSMSMRVACSFPIVSHVAELDSSPQGLRTVHAASLARLSCNAPRASINAGSPLFL